VLRLALGFALLGAKHEGREGARNARKPFAPFVHFVTFVIHNSPRNARCSSAWNRCSAWRSASRCWAWKRVVTGCVAPSTISISSSVSPYNSRTPAGHLPVGGLDWVLESCLFLRTFPLFPPRFKRMNCSAWFRANGSRMRGLCSGYYPTFTESSATSLIRERTFSIVIIVCKGRGSNPRKSMLESDLVSKRPMQGKASGNADVTSLSKPIKKPQ